MKGSAAGVSVGTKGRAVGVHGGWREERAAGAPDKEPGCRTVYKALESDLGTFLEGSPRGFGRGLCTLQEEAEGVAAPVAVAI